MKKLLASLLVCALLNTQIVLAEEASETPPAEATPAPVEEVAPVDGEADYEVAEEAPLPEDLDELNPVGDDSEEPTMTPPTITGDFTPFVDYAEDPMAMQKSIGTYDTDLSSGAATYGYPIFLPTGRVELQPSVSIVYNNQAASSDSIVGYGWSLSVGGSISRMKDYGVFDIYDTNEFYLNMDGTSGKLLPVDLDDSEHGDYGLQVEEAFYKYEFEADDSWVVTDQNGVKYYFGQSTDSRQDDSADSSRIFEWYLDEVVDLQGDYIRYEYFKDNGRVYPQTIYYTGYGSDDGPFEVDFDLVERDDWTKWYDKGFEVVTDYLVDGISVLYEGAVVREYDLSYTTGENGLRAMLESITESGTSLEGDVVTLPETSFGYSMSTGTYSFTRYPAYSVYPDDAYFIDMNGDGYADVAPLEGSSSTSYLYSALGSVTGFGGEYFDLFYGKSWSTMELSDYTNLVDMNGDMLPEPVSIGMPSRITNEVTARNYGDGFAQLKEGYSIGGGYRDVRGYRFGDFDGDGLQDLFTGDGSSADWTVAGESIYLNTGDYEFIDSGYDSPIGFAWGAYTTPSYYWGQDTGARLVDINGDGLTDIVFGYVDQNYDFDTYDDGDHFATYYLNTGDGQFVEDADYDLSSSSYIAPFVAHMSYSAYTRPDGSYSATSQDVCFRDFNGDGVMDTISGGNVYLWDGVDTWTGVTISNPYGTSFVSCGGKDYASSYYMYYGNNDLNADGLADFFTGWSLETGTNRYVYISDQDKPDLLTSVSASGGADISIEYQSAPQYSGVDDLTIPVYTVSEVTIDDGFGDESVIAYDYSDGHYYKYFNGLTGEFSKFGEVFVIEDGVETIYYFELGCHEGELCANGLEDRMTISADGGYYVTDGNYLRLVTVANLQTAGLCAWSDCRDMYVIYETGFVDDFEIGEVWDDYGDTFMYDVDYSQHALKGKLLMTEIYDDSGVLYSRTSNDWDVYDLGDSRYFPYLEQTVEFGFEGESTAQEKAVSYTYNTDYGLVSTETQWGEVEADESSYEVTDYMVGDEIYISNSYAVNDSDWVFKTADTVMENGSGDVLAEARNYYDGETGLGDIDAGLLTAQEQWTDSSWVTTEYTHDVYGNVESVVDPRGYETSVVYDAEGFYPSSITNALGQTQYFEVNYLNGKPSEVTDLNGYVYAYVYDGLGRALSVTGPSVDGSSTVTHATYEYDDTSMPRSVLQSANDGTSDFFNTYTYLDGLGRQVGTSAEGESEYILTDMTYTDRGDVESESLPYFESDVAGAFIEYEYDPLKRITAVTTDLGTTETDYGVWEKTVTDALGNFKTYYYDAYGNLTQADEENDGDVYTTSYEYDLSRRLIGITDALSNVRSFEWDSLGRLISQDEMHAVADTAYAVWSYEYDENGNLIEAELPSGDLLEYEYDELNRVVDDGGISYVYDTAGVGFLAEASDDAGTVSYEYDALGGVVEETREIDGEIYVTGFANDLMGRVSQVAYPDGTTADYTFNEGGFVESVAGVITDLNYSPAGQWLEVDYANGDVTTNVYDSAQMYFLTNKNTVADDGTVLQDLEYTYDAVGNVLTITGEKDVTYGYDDLYRLTRATAVDMYDQTYEYDEIGNMTYKSDIGLLLYDQVGNANVYAITAGGAWVYDYDSAGNVISDGVYDYEYDERNQMTASSDGSEYLYDFSGSRVMKNDTCYPNMFYEEDGEMARKYVFVDGVRVYVDENSVEDPFNYQVGTRYFPSDKPVNWRRFTFDEAFSTEADVVVFAQVQGERNGEDVTVDLQNIGTTTFDMRLEEDRGQDRSWYDGLHTQELVGFTAFDMNSLPSSVYGGVENFAAGAVQSVVFDEPFGVTPVVYAQIQSENGIATVRANILSVNEYGFEMEIQEDIGDGTSGDWDGVHVAEDVAWVAFDPFDSPFGGLAGEQAISYRWELVAFGSAFSTAPVVFASVITENEADVAVTDLVGVAVGGFKVRIDENTLAGWDGRHVDETVSWFAVTP